MISSLAERTNLQDRQPTPSPRDDGSGGGGVGGPASPDEWEPEEEWLRNYMRNVKMHRG